MTTSNFSILSTTFNNVMDMGAKAVQSDATLVIDGYEHMVLLIKQFPWPVATVGDAVEFYAPIGQKMAQPSQNKTKQEGPVAIYETVKNHGTDFLKNILNSGAVFSGTVFAGRPENYTKKEDIKGAFMVMDTPDRDWENETQVLICQGTMHFHWFANQ